jgi:hypothetical protein
LTSGTLLELSGKKGVPNIFACRLEVESIAAPNVVPVRYGKNEKQEAFPQRSVHWLTSLQFRVPGK